jgi:ADP-heptose:LPS heptosyltransferase
MNILLIQLKRIGDLIVTTPAIAAVRKKFPDAKITLAISQDGAALVPALEGIDETIVLKRGLGDFKKYMSILRTRFDYCVDFTRNDRSAAVTLLSRAQKRIVSYRVKRRSPWRRRAYNEFVEHRMRDMHTADYHLSLLEPLGIKNASRELKLRLPNDALESATALRQSAKIDLPSPGSGVAGNRFVIFHPGSARQEKFWEPERWAEAIEHARAKWNLDCVLTGGTSRMEQRHLARIESHLSRPNENAGGGSIVDLSGKTDLLTLAALIAQARLLVTVDSAPVHLAAALKRPQVILFGPTNPFHWRPQASSAIILQGDSGVPVTKFVPKQFRSAMSLISTRAVIDAMDSLLSSPAA